MKRKVSRATADKRIAENHRAYLDKYAPYQMLHYNAFDYNLLRMMPIRFRPGNAREKISYNDVIIMADTETSKSEPNKSKPVTKVKKRKKFDVLQVIPVINYVVAWTLSIRAYDRNIVTLYGHRPSEFIECLNKLTDHMRGQHTFIYFHNLPYDWTFLQKFLIKEYGEPESQLNVKSHYPLTIAWPRFTLRDSLLLAQRGLEKWAKDLQVEHLKSTGKWEYEKIRNQNEELSRDELEYIEHDTLAGVECIQKTIDMLNCNICSIPLTATGIPRKEVRKRGRKVAAHSQYFEPGTPDFTFQMLLEDVYHGGYTHANRHMVGIVIREPMRCYDFKSSYPFWLICGKYPYGGWQLTNDCSIQYILEQSGDYGFIFTLHMYHVDLKHGMPMPVLQVSKILKSVNAIADNGRIISADEIVMRCTSVDLPVILYEYDCDAEAEEVYFSRTGYLPRWFSDYVFECFTNKEKTDKKQDPVGYSINKAKVNSLYGMCAQKPVKLDIFQDYVTGEYKEPELTERELLEYFEDKYNEWKDKKQNVLLYSTGVWCTALAQKALFDLSRCCRNWVYTDTDSIYGFGWDEEKIEKYNAKVKQMLISRGYGSVINADGNESWLGIADLDKDGITEFCTMGAKRYCYRDAKGLHITVAGVPKSGVAALNDNIENFKIGFIFPGTVSGKKLHSYIIQKEIYTDERGNEIGDSIDLNPCDYMLDQTDRFDEEDFNAMFDEYELLETEIFAFDFEESEDML